MAKPIAGESGSSMHLHQSVLDSDGRNLFSRSDGSASPQHGQFIAGLQAYTGDLMLVYAPYINSYRRYVRGVQAPTNLHWAMDNRTTGLRVPISPPDARRVENRIAGADANPYLAIAASLAAGLAGMDEGLEPTPAADGNAHDLDHGHELPRSFLHAYERLAQSASAPRLIPPRFIEAYLSVKALEYDHFQREISAWERRYLLPQA